MDEVTLVKNHFRKEQWKQMVLDCQNSGLTVKQWCEQNHVTHHAYYYWLRKLRTELCDTLPVSVDESKKPVVFKKLEVQAPISGAQAAVIIHLSSATLEIQNGADQQTVEAVLLALKNIC
ncbi:MAG TPA: IS66 family insertion sequence element accessory protein TnpB [Clostridiales bacterium]|nr:IS66 family insertion sequence element accessory protein TnpB [Clostridiales bacterium]